MTPSLSEHDTLGELHSELKEESKELYMANFKLLHDIHILGARFDIAQKINSYESKPKIHTTCTKLKIKVIKIQIL